MDERSGGEDEDVESAYHDCDNSAGIIDFPDMKHDLASAGISTYGHVSVRRSRQRGGGLKAGTFPRQPCDLCKRRRAGDCHQLRRDFYGRKENAGRYHSGRVRGRLSESHCLITGSVLIRGKRARILGRVCMDQFMVDVTDIPETIFMDQAVLIGEDGDDRITVEELADLSGRFNYEFVCCLGKRIPRVYEKEGTLS